MKKIFSFILASTLFFSVMPLYSKASTQGISEQKDLSEIESGINQLEQKYGLEEVDLNSIPENQIINFDSVEELEKFITEVKHNEFKESINVSQSKIIKPFSNKISTLAVTNYNDSHVISWYAPFSAWGSTTSLTWKNIAFEYQYYFSSNQPRFTANSITNINSYITGVNTWWWDQTSKSANIVTTSHTSDTVKIKVNGNYVLGVAIKGFTIGAKIPGTWEGSLRLY